MTTYSSTSYPGAWATDRARGGMIEIEMERDEVAEALRAEILKRDDPVPLLVLLDMLVPPRKIDVDIRHTSSYTRHAKRRRPEPPASL